MNAPVPRLLSADFYKAAQSRDPEDMARYLMIERTNMAPADLIIGFGNIHVAPQIAHQCADLYAQGFAPRIILTGGKEHDDGRTESAFMAGILRDRGVPDDVVCCETQSMNTQENVQNSRAMLARLAPSSNPKSAIAVGHIIAGRRFLMTLSQNWPELTTLMAANAWPPGVTPDNWRMKQEYVSELSAQFDRIAPYLERGFIREIDLARETKAAPNKRREPCP